MTNEDRIELCLKRLSMGKTSDVVNFSYADALAYIERLKEENAELRKLLKNERHEAEKRKMALELACLDMIKGGLRWMEDWQGKIAAYMKRAEEYIDNGNEYRLTFMFRDVRVTEQKERE